MPPTRRRRATRCRTRIRSTTSWSSRPSRARGRARARRSLPGLRKLTGFASTIGFVSDNGSQPLRVLVVDDEPNIADVISMALRYEGFDVSIAANGAEALAAVNSYRPHLMVLDI